MTFIIDFNSSGTDGEIPEYGVNVCMTSFGLFFFEMGTFCVVRCRGRLRSTREAKKKSPKVVFGAKSQTGFVQRATFAL